MKNAILITGVSTGIGFALAESFAKNGYQVFGSVRKLEDAMILMEKYSDNFLPLIFDVTDFKSIEAAAIELEGLLKGEPLLGLINNAGIAVTGVATELSIDDFKHQFEVNFFGLVKVTQVFSPLLGAVKGFRGAPGRIMNISSAGGQIGFPFMSPYCSSKHAVEGFSESLRREFLHLGIKVIIIGPTAIKTPIWDKASSELPDDKKKGIFGKQASNFLRFFLKSSAKAMPVGVFAEKVLSIFRKKSPKNRYAISVNAFADWIMPRYLPSEMVDKSMADLLNK